MVKKPLTCLEANKILVSPSILAADFANLGEDIRRIETHGADLVHLDVMDGHFVPNISFGVPVIKSVRASSTLPFDVHLMISHPDQYLQQFSDAGADHITIHVEASCDVRETLRQIRELGCSAGLTLRPGTPASALAPFMDLVDLILVMTVEPGFGGQSFNKEMLPKIQEIRRMIEACEQPVHLEVDGGITAITGAQVLAAGANMLVAGTSVFGAPDMAKAIRTLKNP
jgi:ribulose-phosphate 3-epimerase